MTTHCGRKLTLTWSDLVSAPQQDIDLFVFLDASTTLEDLTSSREHVEKKSPVPVVWCRRRDLVEALPQEERSGFYLASLVQLLLFRLMF